MKNSNGMNTLKKISINLVIINLFIIPIIAHGENPSSINSAPNPSSINDSAPININIPNPTTAGSTLMEVLTALLNKVVMPVAAVAVVIWIIWAGFTYVVANGNPEKIKKAHERLLWALVGAGILLGAAGISAVVKSTIEGVLK